MKKGKSSATKSFPYKALLAPGAFVFCERTSGAIRFQVEAAPNGSLPVEKAASMLAMHCLVRGQTPVDYIVLVKPESGLLDPVGRRAGELLNVGRAIRSDLDLTRRESEVLECVVQSLSNKEIAARLNVAPRTVKFHVSALLTKFKVQDRFALIRRALFGGQLLPDAPAANGFGLSMEPPNFPVPGSALESDLDPHQGAGSAPSSDLSAASGNGNEDCRLNGRTRKLTLAAVPTATTFSQQRTSARSRPN